MSSLIFRMKTEQRLQLLLVYIGTDRITQRLVVIHCLIVIWTEDWTVAFWPEEKWTHIISNCKKHNNTWWQKCSHWHYTLYELCPALSICLADGSFKPGVPSTKATPPVNSMLAPCQPFRRDNVRDRIKTPSEGWRRGSHEKDKIMSWSFFHHIGSLCYPFPSLSPSLLLLVTLSLLHGDSDTAEMLHLNDILDESHTNQTVSTLENFFFSPAQTPSQRHTGRLSPLTDHTE